VWSAHVHEAVAAATDEESSEAVKENLLDLWGTYERSLRQALEARMTDRTEGLRKRIEERAAKEGDDMAKLLTELERAIEEQLGAPEPEEYRLQFTELERDGCGRNGAVLEARVRAIP